MLPNLIHNLLDQLSIDLSPVRPTNQPTDSPGFTGLIDWMTDWLTDGWTDGCSDGRSDGRTLGRSDGLTDWMIEFFMIFLSGVNPGKRDVFLFLGELQYFRIRLAEDLCYDSGWAKLRVRLHTWRQTALSLGRQRCVCVFLPGDAYHPHEYAGK